MPPGPADFDLPAPGENLPESPERLAERAGPPSAADLLQTLGLHLDADPQFVENQQPFFQPAPTHFPAANPPAPAASATRHRLSELPAHERPRERLLLQGPESLKDSELIALFLRTGNQGGNAVHLAEELLHECGGLPGLERLDLATLTLTKGVGNAKAIQLKAALELGRRLAVHRSEQVPLTSPEQIYALLAPELHLLSVEVIKLLLLNTRHHLIRTIEISRGSLNESIAHPREVLRPAIVHHAHAIVLVHNHPSGDPAPSSADRRLTRSIRDAADLFQIALLDHLIVGRPDRDGQHPGWFSFAEAGLL